MPWARRDWGMLFLLVLVCLLSHASYVNVGYELTNGDLAPGLIVAREIREGARPAFYMDLPYGGTVFAYFRALWTAAWEFFSRADDSHVISHMSFQYLALPAAFTAVTFACLRRFVSSQAAFFASLWMAVGFQFWGAQCTIEFYVAYLMIGFFLLAWKTGLTDPLTQLSRIGLFGAGVLTGFSVYTHRITLLYLVAFFVPWNRIGTFLKRILAPSDRVEWLLFGVALFFVALFFYLDVFGVDLGQFRGRSIRLHAKPNLHYAAVFLVALALKVRGVALTREVTVRGLLFGMGLVLGFTPELVHFARMGTPPPASNGGLMDFSAMMNTLALLFPALREMFTAGAGVGRNASLILALLSLSVLFVEGGRHRKVQSVVGLAILSILAFSRIATYTAGNARYLLPILPAFLVGFGMLWERALQRKGLVLILLGGLFSVHLAHHLVARAALLEPLRGREKYHLAVEITEVFRRAGVSIVASDDYWNFSNNLTVVSQGNPIYMPPDAPGLKPAEGFRRLRTAERIGVLRGASGSSDEVLIEGRRWKLRSIARVGDRELFLGDVVPGLQPGG